MRVCVCVCAHPSMALKQAASTWILLISLAPLKRLGASEIAVVRAAERESEEDEEGSRDMAEGQGLWRLTNDFHWGCQPQIYVPPPVPESTLSILKQELFMNHRGTYAGKEKKRRTHTQSGLKPELFSRASAPGGRAVNKKPGMVQAPNGDHHKASRPQI